MPYLVLGIMIAVIAVTLWVIYLLSKFMPAISTEPPEPIRPHKCPKGEFWMPTMSTVAVKVADIGTEEVVTMTMKNGRLVVEDRPEEYGVVRFLGIRCGRCGAELECKACGGTPKPASIIPSEEEHWKALACCARPVFGERNS